MMALPIDQRQPIAWLTLKLKCHFYEIEITTALEIVISTIPGAASNENFLKIISV